MSMILEVLCGCLTRTPEILLAAWRAAWPNETRELTSQLSFLRTEKQQWSVAKLALLSWQVQHNRLR